MILLRFGAKHFIQSHFFARLGGGGLPDFRRGWGGYSHFEARHEKRHESSTVVVVVVYVSLTLFSAGVKSDPLVFMNLRVCAHEGRRIFPKLFSNGASRPLHISGCNA